MGMRRVISPVLGFMCSFHHGALQQKGLVSLSRCGLATSTTLTDEGLSPGNYHGMDVAACDFLQSCAKRNIAHALSALHLSRPRS
eukprot:1161966-Pelagomonas_calceolata.AAC.13